MSTEGSGPIPGALRVQDTLLSDTHVIYFCEGRHEREMTWMEEHVYSPHHRILRGSLRM